MQDFVCAPPLIIPGNWKENMGKHKNLGGDSDFCGINSFVELGKFAISFVNHHGGIGGFHGWTIYPCFVLIENKTNARVPEHKTWGGVFGTGSL